jgi:hypothetical protein
MGRVHDELVVAIGLLLPSDIHTGALSAGGTSALG